MFNNKKEARKKSKVVYFLFTAHGITNMTVGMSILFIWISAVFWSTAPLVGWGSYTGQYDTEIT